MTFCEGNKYRDAVGRVWHVDHVVISPENQRLLLIKLDTTLTNQRTIAIDNLNGTATVLEATGLTTLYCGEGRMIELKPCPFCGRAVKIIHVDPCGYNVAQFNDEYAVTITHTGEGECFLDTCMLTYTQREESMMIELWNRRVKE